MKLIIVRHGQTNFNELHQLDGRHETELTPLGKKQAGQLAEKLKGYKINKIFSSPLKRAIDTANIIIESNPVEEMILVPEFTEIDCGKTTGMTKAEIGTKFPELVSEWEKNTDPPFPEGESLRDVEKRAIPKLLEIIKNNPDSTVLISGHGSLNIALIGYFLEIPSALRFRLKQSNCCINEIDFNEEKIQVVKVNYF